MKKILVTGAGGFVGARILEMWRDRFELSAFPPDFLRTADETAVRRFITAERPDVIVHTAALSNTQVCQQHPEESFRANVLLPEWVAAAAAETGEVLHFSRRDHRGVGYVREVIANLLPAMALPGGVYNFGSGNDKDMVDTALYFAHLLQVDVRIEETDFVRNLVMDGQKLQEHGIVFRSTQGAFRQCLADHGMDI